MDVDATTASFITGMMTGLLIMTVCFGYGFVRSMIREKRDPHSATPLTAAELRDADARLARMNGDIAALRRHIQASGAYGDRPQESRV